MTCPDMPMDRSQVNNNEAFICQVLSIRGTRVLWLIDTGAAVQSCRLTLIIPKQYSNYQPTETTLSHFNKRAVLRNGYHLLSKRKRMLLQ